MVPKPDTPLSLTLFPFTVLLVSCCTGEYSVGMANLFIQHTSASLTINENCDPDVRVDMESALNAIVPESWNKEVRAVHGAGNEANHIAALHTRCCEYRCGEV